MCCFFFHLSILWCCGLMMTSLMMLVEEEVVHTGIIRQGKSFTNSVWFVFLFSFVCCDFCSVWNSTKIHLNVVLGERCVLFLRNSLIALIFFSNICVCFFLCLFRSINSAIVFLSMSCFAGFVWSDHVDFVFFWVFTTFFVFFTLLYFR